MSHIPSSALDIHLKQVKKGRNRHTPAQIAALNEVFDRNEKPDLQVRTALAESLGMEIRVVSSWFQNKRQSTKKKLASNLRMSPEVSIDPAQSPPHPDDEDDVPTGHTGLFEDSKSWSLFYAGNPEHSHFMSEPLVEPIPRRQRQRPTAQQTEELKRFYLNNPNPSTEERHMFAERIGMRYQTVSNWFQNQRSHGRRKHLDEKSHQHDASSHENLHDARTYSAFPPPSNHPSLNLPPPTYHPSLALDRLRHRSPSIGSSLADDSPARRRSVTPYSTTGRTRPEPYQLEALRELYAKTPNPTIEQRSTLALQIGMDLTKVTNWFRNLRQTARKRAAHANKSDDDDDEYHPPRSGFWDTLPSGSASRSGTPSFNSSSSSSGERMMEMDEYYDDKRSFANSDFGSEEDYQEAVTPPPVSSPPRSNNGAPRTSVTGLHLTIDQLTQPELEKAVSKVASGIKVEDALLLLSFHQHIVR